MENENAEIADLTNENPEEIPQESLVNEEEILNRIYLGDLEDLPSLTSKIVRIFTSSTFTDTTVERNMLIETTYPRLKEYCREQHGLEFQVVDMRWGVRDESTDDHKTTDLCMQEIDNCQRLSLGPNFVVFLCQKYGYRPLPNRVLDTEFLMITDILEEEDASLLKLWYQLDSNSVPNVYVLQPVSSIYKNFTNKKQKQLMEEDQSKWWKTMAQLCTVIRKGSARLLANKKFSVEDNHRYNWSVTEQEVVRGILNSKNNVDHTLAFIREIKNINVKLFTHSAKFIDINFAARKIDEEAQQMLSLLRDVKVPEKLVSSSIIHYSIDWTDNEGINKNEHESYLINFCDTFYTRIVDLIEKAIAKQMKITQNKMYSEILHHLHVCNNFIKLFKGREEILEKIRQYIFSEERNQPFSMYGISGSGKSSILAKAASQIKPWVGKNCEPILIIRFLGTTPDSSSVYPLLKNLCSQISYLYQKPIDNIPAELSNLTNYFKKLLECATPEKPLYIFLDSLDGLSASNSAHSLSWMPVNLPKNVKIVVSTLTGYYGIVETLRNMIEIIDNFAEVQPLGEELAWNVMNEMLANINRTISGPQLPIVREALAQCNSPLYVKLVYDQISLWKSYTTDNVIAKSIEECIIKLFERVENAHGRVLVSHALAYVTASKNGLSEAELEDLISLDETVLNDIYQYHLPPIRRIPPLLWTRIRNDIYSYLSEREADGVSVVFWYHRQFIQVSTQRYLSDPSFKLYCHSQIADYFMGIWANVPKPYSYTEEQKRMFLLKSLHGEADRKVPPQPEIFYNPNDNSVRYNGRKLSELPFHLIRSNRIEELYSKVLFHYKFLYAKLACMPLNSLIADFEDFLSYHKYDKEVVLVSDALRLASSILSASPTNLVPQIIGRLLPYTFINSNKFANVRSLIAECEDDGLRDSAFVPAFNCFHVPGGPLVYSLEGHPFAVYGLTLLNEETQLLSVSNRFIIFDLSSGDIVRVINPQIEGILQSLSVSSDRKYCVSYSNNDQIVICNIISGDVKVLNRYTSSQPAAAVPEIPEKPVKQAPGKGNAPNSKNTKAAPAPPPKKESVPESKDSLNAGMPKEYTDTFMGSSSGLNYFVVYSRYYFYVYDKKGRIIKAEKLPYPIIQMEVIENQSIQNYGCELEIITRAEDCRDDEEKERDYLILEYRFILDNSKIPKKSKDPKDPTEADVMNMYVASAQKIEIHSCMILTRDKKKLYACTEIGDNVVECYRRKSERIGKNKYRNAWKYHASLDDNMEKISALVLSEDETYMLGVVISGFKVFYLLTGLCKPLKFPAGVKNIQIGYKKLSFPAVFSKDNKFVVAGVRDNIYIWDTSYGTYIKALDAHYGRITCLLGSFKDSKNLVLSSSMDKSIKIWNLNNIMEEDFPLHHLEKPIEALHVSIIASIVLAQSRNQLAIISLKDGKIKYQLCHNPHGAIFNCSAMTSTGAFAASSESNRLVIWDLEEKKPTYVSTSQSSVVHIKQMKFHQSEIYLLVATLDNNTKLVTITNYIIPDGEVVYTVEYNLKPNAEYKNFVVSTDDQYLVVFRNDKKFDCLAIYLASDGSAIHNVKLQYPAFTPEFQMMVPMYKNPHYIAIVDSDKGTFINVKDKKFVRSIQKWNGRATKDDKNGLYAPTRGGMEVLDLKNGSRVKVLIPKVAEGVFDVDTIITENDKHVVYYHSGKRTIRLFRLEDGKKIADYKSTAKVRCMICSQDSKNLIIGCEDGTVNMLMIVDPEIEDYVNNLREWRAEQMTLFMRDAAPSPTPEQKPQDQAIPDTSLFKGINALNQLFEIAGEEAEKAENNVISNTDGADNVNSENISQENKPEENNNESNQGNEEASINETKISNGEVKDDMDNIKIDTNSINELKSDENDDNNININNNENSENETNNVNQENDVIKNEAHDDNDDIVVPEKKSIEQDESEKQKVANEQDNNENDVNLKDNNEEQNEG